MLWHIFPGCCISSHWWGEAGQSPWRHTAAASTTLQVRWAYSILYWWKREVPFSLHQMITSFFCTLGDGLICEKLCKYVFLFRFKVIVYPKMEVLSSLTYSFYFKPVTFFFFLLIFWRTVFFCSYKVSVNQWLFWTKMFFHKRNTVIKI